MFIVVLNQKLFRDLKKYRMWGKMEKAEKTSKNGVFLWFIEATHKN